MEELIRDALDVVIPLIEALGAFVVVVGAVHAFGLFVASRVKLVDLGFDGIRLRLARYLALALEFQLGADILSTAISPTFDEIGKLGAVATIRTALQFFLAREMAGDSSQTAAIHREETDSRSGRPADPGGLR